MSEYHIPVLLEESVSSLITNPDGTYADATFGGGGHTAAILSRLSGDGRVIAFDRDIDAINGALKDSRLTLIHNNFRFIENYAEQIRREAGPEGTDSPESSLRDPSHAPALRAGSGPLPLTWPRVATDSGECTPSGISSHTMPVAPLSMAAWI